MIVANRTPRTTRHALTMGHGRVSPRSPLTTFTDAQLHVMIDYSGAWCEKHIESGDVPADVASCIAITAMHAVNAINGH